jgi:hypothetical protein
MGNIHHTGSTNIVQTPAAVSGISVSWLTILLLILNLLLLGLLN